MIVFNSCQKCANFLGNRKCFAFPIQIPDKIWIGQNHHKQNVVGDKGIRFEPIDEQKKNG